MPKRPDPQLARVPGLPVVVIGLEIKPRLRTEVRAPVIKLYSDASNNDNYSEDTMQVAFNLPEEIVRYLVQDAQTLSRAALEALALEGIRAGKLSTAQARRVLGFRTRQQMDAFLKSHGVHLPLTMEQVRHDSESALAFSARV